ncbi:MAG: hypothetical protein ACR2FY_06185 [Pirellulaceae bacterium]
MNAPASSEIELARPASLYRASALLVAALLALLPCFAVFGYCTNGAFGILAAVAACGICLTCGILALAITAISQAMNQGVQGILAAMLVRMGVPLVAMFVLPEIGGPLVEAGVTGMVMAYYLVTLAVETWLSLRFVSVTKNAGAKRPATKVA